MEKFRVRCRDAFHVQNGPINFHENAYIHRIENPAVMSVNTDLSYDIKTIKLFTWWKISSGC